MNEDFKLLLQTSIDMQRSKKQINKEINLLQKQIKNLVVDIKIDNHSIKQALQEAIQSVEYTVQINFDYKDQNLVSNLDSFLINNTESLSSVKTQITELQVEFDKLGQKITDTSNSSGLRNLQEKLNNMISTMDSSTSFLNNINNNSSGASSFLSHIGKIGNYCGIIGSVVSLGISGISAITEHFKKAKEELKEVKDEIGTISKEITKLNKNTTNFDSLAKEYSNLKNNANKTKEEIDRFYEIQNELKEILPIINGYYDEQGNFIIDESYSYNILNGELKEYIRQKREERADKAKDVAKDTLKDFHNNNENLQFYSEECKKVEKIQPEIDRLYKKIFNTTDLNEQSKYENELNDLCADYTTELTWYENNKEELENYKKKTNASIVEIREYVVDLISSDVNWDNYSTPQKNEILKTISKLDNENIADIYDKLAFNKISISEAFDSIIENIDDFDILDKAKKKTDDWTNSLGTLEERITTIEEIIDKTNKLNSILNILNKNGSLTYSEKISLLNISGDFRNTLDDTEQLKKAIIDKIHEYEYEYTNANVNLIADSNEYYSKILNNEDSKNISIKNKLNNLVDDLNLAYKIDLKNYATVEAAKQGITTALFSSITGMWGKYIDPETGEIDSEKFSSVYGDPNDPDNFDGRAYFTVADSSREYKQKRKEALEKFNNIILEAFNLGSGIEENTGNVGNKDYESNLKNIWDNYIFDGKQTYKEYYDYLQHQRNIDEISEEEYLEKLSNLRNSYFETLKKADPKIYDVEDISQKNNLDEELYKLNQDVSKERIENWEHELQLHINAKGSDATRGEQIRVYTQIQDELHKLAEDARDHGIDKNSEYIKSLQNQWWDYLEKIKSLQEDYYQDQQSLYENYISAAEKIQNLTISMIKKRMELEKDEYSTKISNIKEEFDLKRSLIDDELNDYSYNKELQAKIDAVSKIQNQIDLIKNDDTQSGKLAQLKDELIRATDDLDDYNYRHDIDTQKEKLDEQEKLLTDEYQAKIEKLEENLNDEVYLRNEADRKISGSGRDLYNELISFANEYGTFSINEVNEVWKEYEKVLENFDIEQIGFNNTLDLLHGKLSGIKDVLEEISNMSLGDFYEYFKLSKESILSDMQKNSEAWLKTNDKEERSSLKKDNVGLAMLLRILYGIDIERGSDGHWYDKNTGEIIYNSTDGQDNSNKKNNKKQKNSENSDSDANNIISKNSSLIIAKNDKNQFIKSMSSLSNLSENLNRLDIPELKTPIITENNNIGGINIENHYVINEANKDIDYKLEKANIDLSNKIVDLISNNGSNKISANQFY